MEGGSGEAEGGDIKAIGLGGDPTLKDLDTMLGQEYGTINESEDGI